MVKQLLILILVLPFFAISQSSGFLDYDIEVKGITPEVNKGAAFLTNSNMRISFSDSAIRQDYNFGEYSRKTTILNYSMNQGIFYEDGVNGKYGVFGTCDQINKLIHTDTNMVVDFVDEQKQILNFECNKAILTLGTGEKVEYWYTKNFPLTLPKYNLFNPKIPGVILEFSSVSNGFFMRFKCSNYSDSLTNSDQLFLPKTTRDYKIIEFNSYIYYLKLQQQKQLEASPQK